MDTRQVIARFEAERQSLALMDHPNIARVFDAGATESGRPYFVMELVAGPPITEYCDAGGLDLKARLDLFAAVCQAVQHAHQKGVIHRDLKPSNVLIADQNNKPAPKVIDFGIARAVDDQRSGGSLVTEHGQMIGTPEYMSPEQATGEIDIDTRTDVYSLGVLLYELLTGSTPVERASLERGGRLEIRRLISEIEPVTPSTRIKSLGAKAAAIAKERRTDPAALSRMLHGDLDWIVMKALEKERSRRYETVSSLAADVERHLRHEPVSARPPTASYRFRKFARRNRGALAAGVAMFALLVGGVVGTSIGLYQAIAARDAAVAARNAESRQRIRAEAINSFMRGTLQASTPHGGGHEDIRVGDVMIQAVRELDAGVFRDDPRTEAYLFEAIASILTFNGRPAEALPLAERALAAQDRLTGHDELDRANCYMTLGLVLKHLGRVAEAELNYQKGVEILEQHHPGDHSALAQGLCTLADARLMLGRAEEAESMLQRALEMSRRLFSSDDTLIAVSLNNLGQARQLLGRMAEAEPLYEEALAINRRLFRGDHPDVADSLNNLAFARQILGKPADAEPLYVEALEMNQRLFKGDHPSVARSLNNLGLLWRSTGRTEEALPLYVRALEMNQRLFEGDHPTVALGLNNIATAKLNLGSVANAEPLFEQSVNMTRRLFPDGHQDAILRMLNLARCRIQLGRRAEALIVARDAADMASRILPPQHPFHAKCDALVAELSPDEGERDIGGP